MHRIFYALIEMMAAAIFIIPIWYIYHKFYVHSWKRTIPYMIFGFYLIAMLALVGFPNITWMKIQFTVNIIPFVYMRADFANACLNILLFIPLGFFLPTLWTEFRSIKKTFWAGVTATSCIELSQIFTNSATDIDDIITNVTGTLIGYFIARCLTKAFTKRILTNSKIEDLYVVCASVIVVMFFFQPFFSSVLWGIIQ